VSGTFSSQGAPSVPALWSRSDGADGADGGVRVGSIDRMVDPLLDARARTEHAELSGVDQAYRQLVTELGALVASATRVAANEQVPTDQIDGAREALSGVDIDEEMVQMLTYQRAYEAAARVLTTVDSILDTLINRTGLVR
jgi:flagellar hook-associated protein 1